MILMVIFCTIMRSGVLRAATHQVRCIPDATRILVLSALLTMLGVFTLAGCYLSTTINQATAKDVNNRTFTFTSGAVFNPALANVSTGLAFSNNAQNFALCSGSQTATGTNKFGSCTLTVTNSSYSTGPQKNDVIKLDPCDFDSDFNTLTVSHGGSTVTSAAATTTAGTGCSSTTPATPSEVNNLRFTFPNGGVFDPALLNVSTSLAFSNRLFR